MRCIGIHPRGVRAGFGHRIDPTGLLLQRQQYLQCRLLVPLPAADISVWRATQHVSRQERTALSRGVRILRPLPRAALTFQSLRLCRATREIKRLCPGCKISGGVSNIAFGFRGNDAVRRGFHSAFLHYACKVRRCGAAGRRKPELR